MEQKRINYMIEQYGLEETKKYVATCIGRYAIALNLDEYKGKHRNISKSLYYLMSWLIEQEI